MHSGIDDYVSALEGQTSCEVRRDRTSRAIYATDASIFRIAPLLVVLPRAIDDLVAAVRMALERDLPILLRGGGTSLAGQTVGEAVVIDASRYLHAIHEIDADARTARVQPGVVLDQLNQATGRHGLMFAPDVATSSRATLGGMIANNSSGARSIRYGTTIDHVLSLRCILSDKTEATFAPIQRRLLSKQADGPGVEAACYRVIPELVSRHAEEIRQRYPKILRRVGGYNLDRLLSSDRFNLADLIVGSEGTLAVVTEATLRLTPRPKNTILSVLHFKDIFAAADAMGRVLETNPMSVELLDKFLLDLTKQSLLYRHKRWFLQGDPGAVLVIEYADDDRDVVESAVGELTAMSDSGKLGYTCVRIDDPDRQADVWAVRKSGLPLLLGLPGRRKPATFVEDGAVDPSRLGEFVRRFEKIVRSRGSEAAYYGHASVGLLHIRPLIDLKDCEDIERMAAIQREVCDLILELGGSMSGEHGDGLLRSHLNRHIFGDELYEAFRKVKQTFDPRGLLNPGKIVDAPPMTSHHRFGSDYSAKSVSTLMDFQNQGGFAEAIELCNGSGVCRKRLTGTMCPSYMATMDEDHSTRGRANALREALSGKLPEGGPDGDRINEVMDLCLSCKACKSECPSNVDMAKIKSEWLYQKHLAAGAPLRDRLFGNVASVNRWGSRLSPLSNLLAGSAPVRLLNELCFGVDRRRRLPRFASETLFQWFKANRPTTPPLETDRRRVALFADCFCNYNEPTIAKSAVKVLEACGFDVTVPRPICCGRAAISRGLLDDARQLAEAQLAALMPLVEEGMWIVGLEPSCLLTFRDEYLAFRLGPNAQRLADRCLLIDEFLTTHAEDRLVGLAADGKKAILHGHCHQKALIGTTATESLLGRVEGLSVTTLDSGCCGMAGSFGYAKSHYEVSMRIGERVLLPACRAATNETVILAPGTSCRHQIDEGAGRRAVHPIEFVADSLPSLPT
jgi:FAD/FMN-containing dehydrogenase/Fe-S oxidoreductase